MVVVRSLQRIEPLFGQRLPVRSVLMVFAVLFIGAAASFWLVTTRLNATNPFDAYATIMPGQPVSVLEAFDCSSAYTTDRTLSVFYCMIRPKDGPIRSISINSARGKVESITYRASDVRVGDLIEHWGHPDLTRVFQRSFTLAWDEGIYVIGSVQGRYSYWSKANYVLVMSLEN